MTAAVTAVTPTIKTTTIVRETTRFDLSILSRRSSRGHGV